MTTTCHTSLAAVLVAVLATVAVAQPPTNLSPAEMVKRADSDGDGKVSRNEFIKARTADLEAAFDRLDTSGDGSIDEQEAEAAVERMRSLAAGGREGGFRRPEGDRPVRPDGGRTMRREGDRPGIPGAEAGGEAAFNRLDGDGDGKLSREEFATGMARLREFMQRGMPTPGSMPERGGRGPEEGFRKPPQQD